MGLDSAAVHAQLEEMASQGLRVLAFARGEVPAGSTVLGHNDIANLTFLGLQGMIDPPRPEAIDAVRTCQNAGIRIKMITGDHPVTARAIASKIGLNGTEIETEQSPLVMTSQDLAEKSDQELIDIAEKKLSLSVEVANRSTLLVMKKC